jgi:hypothetical protein
MVRETAIVGCAVGRLVSWVAVLTISAATAACGTTSPLSSSQPPATSQVATATDEAQLRDLYTRLAAALGEFDADAVAGMTCAKYQDVARSRIDDDPVLRIDFFGDPAKNASLGVDVLTERLQAGLATASPDDIHAVAVAIVNGDATAYTEAMKRVRREGVSTKLDHIDKIQVTGDAAVVDGVMTSQFFNRPPETFAASNQAIRVDGRWEDCTPPRR